jgi:hypothetical protein
VRKDLVGFDGELKAWILDGMRPLHRYRLLENGDKRWH